MGIRNFEMEILAGEAIDWSRVGSTTHFHVRSRRARNLPTYPLGILLSMGVGGVCQFTPAEVTSRCTV